MNNWDTSSVKGFGEVISGGTPSTTVDYYWNGNIIWITPADLSKITQPFINTSLKKITKEGLASSSANLIPAYNIVMSSRAPIGYFAIPEIDFCTNQGCKSIKINDNNNSLFHYYNLSFNVSNILKYGEGTTFAEISKKQLEKVEFSYPPLPQQEKIAKILSTCDSVINHTEQAIKKYEAIKQGMMKDLFTRGIDVNTDKLRPSYEEQPDLYKESESGWIPKDWDIISLCSIINVSSGQGLSQAKMKSGIFPVYGGNGITGYHNDYLFNESKLIIGRVGEHCGNVHRTQKYSWITDNALIVRPVLETEFNPDFWFYLLSYIKLNDFAFAAAQPVITGGIIKKILIANIGLIEQKLIVEAISTIDKKIQTEKDTFNKYQQIKAGLMQDLLTGKVEVQTNDAA